MTNAGKLGVVLVTYGGSMERLNNNLAFSTYPHIYTVPGGM